jgi:hypothetical protein
VKITIENTSHIVTLNDGIPCRVWEGETSTGIKVQCLIPRIAVKNGQDTTQFEAELIEQKPPSADALQCFPLRTII